MNIEGTTLYLDFNDSAIVLAVDSLGHYGSADRPVPAQGNFKKFAVLEDRFVVATVGMLYSPEIEYEFEDWVSNWVTAKLGAISPKTPYHIALSLHDQMGKTIKRLERIPDSALWKFDPRFDLVVDLLATYIVVGYDKGVPQLFKFVANIDRDKRRIDDIFVGQWPNKPAIFGNQEFLSKIDNPGIERDAYLRIRDAVESHSLPLCAQELACDIVARVKVEAHFNNQRVGGTINAVVIERDSGRASLYSF